VLLVNYRNDEDAPQTPDSRYGYGFDEWQDVAAAMDYAQAQGARRFVLAGNSMGGAIVMALLQQPRYAALVSGVVLDAPVLDLEATIDFHGKRRNLPSPITWSAKRVAALRYDIDWPRLDFLRQANRLSVPILLFHGTDDTTVPVSTSDALARQRPDIVTYKRLEGVAHVRSWNHDPAAYEQALREFLAKVSP
jgi:pimeloyl-ACP methyl ester carboxylesterase